LPVSLDTYITQKVHFCASAASASAICTPVCCLWSVHPIQWVDTARYLGVTLDTRLTWSTHIDQMRKKAAKRLGVLGPLLNRRSGLPIRISAVPAGSSVL
jgi:hypothetical protein